MLPHNNTVILDVRDIDAVILLRLFKDGPQNVGVPESFLDVVGISVSVGEPVVSSMFSSPEFDGSLD